MALNPVALWVVITTGIQHVAAPLAGSNPLQGTDSHSVRERGVMARGVGPTSKVGQNLLLQADGKPDRLIVKAKVI